jgi:hypothetical protein
VTYEAKKRAEKATGVGPQTDLYVVGRNKVVHLDDKALGPIGAIIDKKFENERKQLGEIASLVEKLSVPGVTD